MNPLYQSMAVDHSWHDPLLITDVPHQQNAHYPFIESLRSSQDLIMADSGDSFPDNSNVIAWGNQYLDTKYAEDIIDAIADNVFDGQLMIGFSLTSPDLVICTGSPDIPLPSYEDSPNLLKGASVELSLENGIEESKMDSTENPPAAARNLTLWQTSSEELCSEYSFELLPQPVVQHKSECFVPIMSINAGSTDGTVSVDGIMFLEDNSFSGGDVIRTDTKIGAGEGLSLYQTARYGNFTYHFKTLESGNYIIDLHLAEIVFTEGPSGMRVFDVFLQEQKVVSGLDIYARVGANRPLIISDLKTYVDADEGLYIRFDGVVGNPILCGISIWKDSSTSTEEAELLKVEGSTQVPQSNTSKVEEEFKKLQVEYESQRKELNETNKALEVLKMENEHNARECQAALKSLRELQNELMRKSMHVGSLAFAVEGQVKEKSRWFSSLRDMTRKLKIMKMEHIKLSEEALSYKKCKDDMGDVTSMIQSKVKQELKLHEDLKIKFMNGARERKELYNKILELKGNIRVFCRCRPLNSEEIAEGASIAFDFEVAKDGELTVKSSGLFKKSFKFDAIFSPQASQVDVFEDTTPFATSVLDGYNVCIFAYGQTGTGKTYTMEGTDESRGVNFRTLEELFRIIDERKHQVHYEICVSVMEVYNEQIRDLLVPSSQQGVAAKRLEIRQVAEGTHHVPGLVEAHVSNVKEVWEVLKTGSNARAVGTTNANEHSSRSHCIYCVMVKGESLLNGECTRSKLWLVDLAGSERVAKTEVQGERLKETQNINRSLSALGDVISALATKSPHVPFRNSKLTHLLQDSLGGDSKTLMFVQISPNEYDLSESLCSLNFASRVRGIELGHAKKQLDSSELIKYKQMVEKTKHEMKSKDVQMKKLEETMHGLDMKLKERDLKNKNLQDKVKELESQLLIERKIARQHIDTKIAEQQQQMRQQQENPLTRPPLATKPFGTHKTFNEGKDQVNIAQPLAENNGYNISTTLPTIVKHNDTTMEKENNPVMIEQLPLPNRTGRASICTTAHRIAHVPSTSAPRRNSLIPLPSALGSSRFVPHLLTLTPILDNKREDENFMMGGIPELSAGDSPKENNSGGKKLLHPALRRSIQKKIQMKSPMQQHIRRGGVNVEKVRVSIGSRGRMAYRGTLLGSARRATKDYQQKPNQRDKERRWNIGTVGRTRLEV